MAGIACQFILFLTILDILALQKESYDLFGLDLHGEKLEALAAYSRLLETWNQRLNLTAIRSPEEVRVKHFLDSLSCFSVIQRPAGRLIDVGTGAGFPGLVLKIVDPGLRLTLVESVAKKARFCETVVQELGLADVTVLSRRAEDIGQDPDYREQFDWAVARAVAAMPVLAEYLLPLVKIGGNALAMKGPGGRDESQVAQNAIEMLGGIKGRPKDVRLPGIDEPRTLLLLEKVRPTPQKYPRRAGMPAKRPLE